MSSNENMYGVSPKVIDAVRAHVHTVNEYRFENDALLRDALVPFFDEALHAEQIMVGNGGTEVLDIIVRAFVDPSDEIILCSPTFMAYESFARMAGARVVDVSLKGESYALDVEGILKTINRTTKLLFITNPNNPTGTIAGRESMDRLINGLPEHVVVVYDEVYHHYVEAADYPRAIDYIRKDKPVIGLHSFSKAYGLAGLRIAYAFSTPELSQYIRKIRRPFMINTLSLVAAMAALKDNDFLLKSRQMNSKGRAFLNNLWEYVNIRYTPSESNFILIKSPERFSAAQFVQHLEHEGVMVRNAGGMGAEGRIRVTVGTPEANQLLSNVVASMLC
ncbi:MAG: histidinol-phosphate transaminase [Agriterribacter sp.]